MKLKIEIERDAHTCQSFTSFSSCWTLTCVFAYTPTSYSNKMRTSSQQTIEWEEKEGNSTTQISWRFPEGSVGWLPNFDSRTTINAMLSYSITISHHKNQSCTKLTLWQSAISMPKTTFTSRFKAVLFCVWGIIASVKDWAALLNST